MNGELTEERVKEIIEKSMEEKGLKRIIEIYRKEHHIHRGTHRGDVIGKKELRTDEFSLDDFKDGESRRAITDQESWTVPTLLNSWVNYGSGYNAVGYFKDNLGIVHLRGLVKDGTINTTVFQLPNGYRPAYKEMHTSSAKQGGVYVIGRCDIDSSGNVTAYGSANEYFSFDGITFRAN